MAGKGRADRKIDLTVWIGAVTIEILDAPELRRCRQAHEAGKGKDGGLELHVGGC